MILLLKNQYNIEASSSLDSNDFASIGNQFLGFDIDTKSYKVFTMKPHAIYEVLSYTVSTDYSVGNAKNDTTGNPLGATVSIYERVESFPEKDFLGVFPIPYFPSEFQLGQSKKAFGIEDSRLFFDINGSLSGVGIPESINTVGVSVYLKINIDKRNIIWRDL